MIVQCKGDFVPHERDVQFTNRFFDRFVTEDLSIDNIHLKLPAIEYGGEGERVKHA